jgi:hypothetical protein
MFLTLHVFHIITLLVLEFISGGTNSKGNTTIAAVVNSTIRLSCELRRAPNDWVVWKVDKGGAELSTIYNNKRLNDYYKGIYWVDNNTNELIIERVAMTDTRRFDCYYEASTASASTVLIVLG